jgi:hypothetical protein
MMATTLLCLAAERARGTLPGRALCRARPIRRARARYFSLARPQNAVTFPITHRNSPHQRITGDEAHSRGKAQCHRAQARARNARFWQRANCVQKACGKGRSRPKTCSTAASAGSYTHAIAAPALGRVVTAGVAALSLEGATSVACCTPVLSASAALGAILNARVGCGAPEQQVRLPGSHHENRTRSAQRGAKNVHPGKAGIDRAHLPAD